jgi:hypothetical protein
VPSAQNSSDRTTTPGNPRRGFGGWAASTSAAVWRRMRSLSRYASAHVMMPPSRIVSPTDNASRTEYGTLSSTNTVAASTHSTACTVTSRSGP